MSTAWNTAYAKASIKDAGIHDIRHKAIRDMVKAGFIKSSLQEQQVIQPHQPATYTPTFQENPRKRKRVKTALNSHSRESTLEIAHKVGTA